MAEEEARVLEFQRSIDEDSARAWDVADVPSKEPLPGDGPAHGVSVPASGAGAAALVEFLVTLIVLDVSHLDAVTVAAE